MSERIVVSAEDSPEIPEPIVVRLGETREYPELLRIHFNVPNITNVQEVLEPYPVVRVFSKSRQCEVEADIREMSGDGERMFVVYRGSAPACNRPQKWMSRMTVEALNPGLCIERGKQANTTSETETKVDEPLHHSASGSMRRVLYVSGSVAALAAALIGTAVLRGCPADEDQKNNPASNALIE